jgi:hypothetical protein
MYHRQLLLQHHAIRGDNATAGNAAIFHHLDDELSEADELLIRGDDTGHWIT